MKSIFWTGVFLLFGACVAATAGEQAHQTRDVADHTHSLEDGTIVFASLNSNGTYKLGPYLDSYYPGPWLLGPLVKVAHSFVATVINVPWDLFVKLKDSNFQLDVIVADWPEYAKLVAPLLVPFTMGLLTAVIVPLVGMCFCCCRCCGRCGGRYKSEDARKEKPGCGCFAGFNLILSCLFILIGAGGLASSSKMLHSVLPHFLDAGDMSVDDLVLFKQKILQDLDTVSINEFKEVINIIVDDLDNLPEMVGGPFMDAGRPTVQNITGSLVNLDLHLRSLQTRLTEVDTITNDVKTTGQAIGDLVDEIRANITTMKTACLALGSSPDCSKMMSPNDLPNVFNFSKTPNMASETAHLNSVMTMDLLDIARTANSTFEDVPKRVNSTSYRKIQEVKDTVNKLIDPIQEALNSNVKTMINGMFDMLNLQPTSLRSQIRASIRKATEETDFETYLLIATVGFPTIIVFLSLLGMILGCAGTKGDIGPRSRNKVSHHGSRINWSAAHMTFFFVFIYMLLGSVCYLIGSPLTFVCSPIKDKTIFTEFLDKPEYWDNKYLLGELILGNGNIPLKGKDIIDACAANKGIYGAFKLENVFRVSDFVDLDQSLPNLDSMFESANKTVRNVVLLENASRQKFQDTLADHPQLDPASLLKDLVDGLANLTLTKTADDLDTAASAMTDPNFASVYQSMAVRLRSLDTDTVPVITSHVAALSAKISSISLAVDDVLRNARMILNKTGEMQDFLQNAGARIMLQSMTSFVSRIKGFGEQYINHVELSLHETIGQCGIVWDIYRVFSGSICGYFLEGFNGYWFSMLIIAIFFIVALISNFKMANYYRRVSDPPTRIFTNMKYHTSVDDEEPANIIKNASKTMSVILKKGQQLKPSVVKMWDQRRNSHKHEKASTET